MPHWEGLTGGELSGMVRRGRRQWHNSCPRSLSLEGSALGTREKTEPLDAHPLVCIECLLGSGDSDHSWFHKSVTPCAGCAGTGIQAGVCAEPRLSWSPHIPLPVRQARLQGFKAEWGDRLGDELEREDSVLRGEWSRDSFWNPAHTCQQLPSGLESRNRKGSDPSSPVNDGQRQELRQPERKQE